MTERSTPLGSEGEMVTVVKPTDLTPLPAAPVTEPNRITAIDALRGFALLGILILNIQSFAMPGSAYINPTAYGRLEGPHYWVWVFSQLLADQKFMTIFSMLFGAGIVLMSSRAEAGGRGSAGVHYRRMGWLILFGILHAHLIWYGDILYFYGVCGLGAWLFRKWRPTPLIIVGTLLVLVPVLINMAFGWTMQFWPPDAMVGINASWSPGPEQLAAEITAYQGNWLEQMWQRVPAALMFETFMMAIWGIWRAGGLMLIGMALFKMGVFSAQRSDRFYITWIFIGALVGLPVIGYGIHQHFAHNWSVEYSFFFGSQFNYVASLLVSMMWVGFVMLAIKHGVARWFMLRLQAVGRMALTNYLMQSVICTFIFYGHGLGYFGQVERVGQIAIVMMVWVVQLTLSPIWLKHFQFGPMEWLWRTLTYWKLQPMRR